MDNNELYQKAGTLMQRALKKYAEGDNEGGDKDRELANQLYDQAKEEMERVSKNIMGLYGENRNFGIIYKVFEENAKDLIKENKNTKPIGKFIKTIKSNKILSEQFKIYDTLCNNTINIDAEDYINEAISIFPTFNRKEVIENNEKLISIIKENKLDELIDIDDETLSLYESIEYLLLNKKTLSNIEDYKNNKDVIKESLIKRFNSVTEENNSITESDYKSDVFNVISKYSKELNSDELQLMEEICNSDKCEVFNKYKKETIKYITEQISNSSNVEDKIDWNNLLTKVNLKEFNEKTILEDVFSFIKINNIINE